MPPTSAGFSQPPGLPELRPPPVPLTLSVVLRGSTWPWTGYRATGSERMQGPKKKTQLEIDTGRPSAWGSGRLRSGCPGRKCPPSAKTCKDAVRGMGGHESQVPTVPVPRQASLSLFLCISLPAPSPPSTLCGSLSDCFFCLSVCLSPAPTTHMWTSIHQRRTEGWEAATSPTASHARSKETVLE